MAQTDAVEDRNRIARIALAGVAALVAVRSLRQGKRKRGVLAALGAVALGYSARAGTGSEAAEIDVEDDREVSSTDVSADTTTETASEATTEATSAAESGLRCAACGEPIVPGQRRGPDENDRTVHEACLQAAA